MISKSLAFFCLFSSLIFSQNETEFFIPLNLDSTYKIVFDIINLDRTQLSNITIKVDDCDPDINFDVMEQRIDLFNQSDVTVEYFFRITGNISEGKKISFSFLDDNENIFKRENFVLFELISEYGLYQNYPNPFNPSTVIKYAIPKEGLVTISIYNVLGEKVASLVNTIQKAGNYEVTFDAARYSSGIYFYRIESGSFSSVKKMLLTK